MNKKMVCILLVSFFLTTGTAFAHTPLCSCYANGDGTGTCEGGFSDGSSAAGVSMTVKDADGKVIESGKMDKFGEFSFKVPTGDYSVTFDAGPGHVVEVDGEDIEE